MAAGHLLRNLGGFWLALQADYDLEETRREIGSELLRVEQARTEYNLK